MEVAEIIEHFRWLFRWTAPCFPITSAPWWRWANNVLYLVRLARQAGHRHVDAAHRKLAMNEARYPADEVRGSAEKR